MVCADVHLVLVGSMSSLEVLWQINNKLDGGVVSACLQVHCISPCTM